MSESSSDDSNEPISSVLVDSILPPASKDRYLSVYNSFIKWQERNDVTSLSEDVLLTYFNEIAKTRKPSSLWGVYSMLKSTLRAKHNIYMKDYINLHLWLRRRNAGFKSTQSKILTSEQINKFVLEAPDDKYLATKVAIIIGVCGGCRSVELTGLTVNDIKMVDSNMIGKVIDSITKTDKLFAIREDFIPVVKKYQALRPADIGTPRFFLSFRDGRCTKQVIGRHKMAGLPKEVAKYLNMPNPERYTGHCYRRSAEAFGAQMKVTNIDKKDKFRCSNQKEFIDMLEFTKQRDNTMLQDCVGVEIEDEIYLDNEELEELELESTGRTEEMEPEENVFVKTEPRDPTTEVHIKTEEIEVTMNESAVQKNTSSADSNTEEVGTTDWNMSTASKIVDDQQITSKAQASTSSKELRSTDIVIEDPDDDIEDLVHIQSETVNRRISLQALQEKSPRETCSPHDTKITVAGKDITIIFKNCKNVGNVTVNIINK